LDRFGDQSYKQRSKWAILFILASLSFSLAIVYPRHDPDLQPQTPFDLQPQTPFPQLTLCRSLPQVLLQFDASVRARHLHPKYYNRFTLLMQMSSLGHAIALPFVMELASLPLYSIW
jgi:hypothetical protein